jgi:hypothetical protein
VSPETISPDTIGPDQIIDAINQDPVFADAARANGITGPDDPRFAVLQERLARRRVEESLRPTPDNYGSDGRPVTSDDWRDTPKGVFSDEVKRRQDELANRGQADQTVETQNGVNAQTARATEEGTINPQAANVVPRQPDQRPIAVQPDGGAYRADDGTMQGRTREQVTREANTLRLPAPGREVPTNEEIVRQRADAEAKSRVQQPPGADPYYVPEGRPAQSPDQYQSQRQADEAFTLADRQRGRSGESVRDTQVAGRPEGSNPQTVYLDDGFPVEIIDRKMVPDPNGRTVEVAVVRRYDPRTGKPEADHVEYQVPVRQLKTSSYAVEPRMAQDFEARAEVGAVDRGKAKGRRIDEVQGLPRQTFRTTAPDAQYGAEGPSSNVKPSLRVREGANGLEPGYTETGHPSVRSPLPNQPYGPPPGKRWSNYEEAMRDFKERESRGQTEPPKSGPDYSKAKSSNQAAPKDRDGRFVVDENGFVMSSAQGPIKFADRKQAAKWILNVGQKESPDQHFEIAVHPVGRKVGRETVYDSFTARERGRSERTEPPPGAGPKPGPDRPTARPADNGPPKQLGGPPRDFLSEMLDYSESVAGNSRRPAQNAGEPPTPQPNKRASTNNAGPAPRSADPKAPINDGLGRFTDDVPVAWLAKLPGNDMRLSPDEFAKLKKSITTEGFREPVIIMAGKSSGTAKLGEGNHRLMVAQQMGYSHVPARVIVGNEYGLEHGARGNFSNDLIPRKGEYFPSDAKPSDVFRSLRQDASAAEPPPRPAEPSFNDKVQAERERLWAEEMKGYKKGKKGNERAVEQAAREKVVREEAAEHVREAEAEGATPDQINDIAQLYRRADGEDAKTAWDRATERWYDKAEKDAMADHNKFDQADSEFDMLKEEGKGNKAVEGMADVYAYEARKAEAEVRISKDSLDNIPFGNEEPNGKPTADSAGQKAGSDNASKPGSTGARTRQESGSGRATAGEYSTDDGPSGGRQTVIPGAERDVRGANQRRADAPLRGGDEAPPKGGLFDEDSRNQGDIFDNARKAVQIGESTRVKNGPPQDPQNYTQSFYWDEQAKRLERRGKYDDGETFVDRLYEDKSGKRHWYEGADGEGDDGLKPVTFKSRAEAEAFLERNKGNSSNATFYSNPFLDPAAWKSLAKAFGVDADYFADLKTRFENIKEAWGQNSGKKTSTLADLGRSAFYSTDGELRALGKIYESPTIKKIADMLFAPADMGRGGAVSRTYHEAVEQRTVSNLNKLSSALYDYRNDKSALNQIRSLVQNPGNIRRGTPIHDAAAKVRDLLDGEFEYLKKAGVKVHGLVGYFPRIVNAEKVLANPSDFVEAATKQYMRDGIASSRQEAAKLAQAWLASVELGHAGARKDGTDFVMLGGTPNSDFSKERVFGRSIETDQNNPLAKYYIQDPMHALTVHFQRTARRAEWARRFGDDLKLWKDLKEQIIKEGNVASLRQVVDAIGVSTGIQRSYQSDAARTAISVLRTWGAIRLLPRATITSLSETAMPAIRSGNGIRMLGDIVRTGYTLMGGLKVERAWAEDLGAISAAIGDTILGRRYFALEPGSMVQQDIMNAYFRRTGLEQFTNAVRVVSINAGQTFIRRLALDVADGGARQKSSRAFLRELGVEDVDGFANWVKSTDNGRPTVDSTRGDTGHEAVYRTALQRFTQQSSLNPNSSTRPKWANHPVGSLVFMLQSYAYAFQKQVLNRAATGVVEAATGKGYSVADRATMLAPAMLLPALVAIQYVLAGPRDAVFGDPSAKEKKPEEQFMQALSRSGLTGILDPYINARTGARYDRDAATAVAGPVLGGLFQTLDAAVKYDVKNSDNTNTAERNLAKALYDATLMPGAAVLGGFMPAPLGALAIQAASSGAAREAFTSSVAGPKTPQRQGPPKPPEQPRPPRRGSP